MVVLLYFSVSPGTVIEISVLPTGSPVQNNQTGLVEFHMDGPLQYMVWYHAVGLIWISEFILACQQMTVAGAVVTYYFTRSEVKGQRSFTFLHLSTKDNSREFYSVSLSDCRDKSQMPFTPIVTSVLRLMRYHLGTVVKGAFIITLVEIPRLLLTYIHSQLKGRVSHHQLIFMSLQIWFQIEIFSNIMNVFTFTFDRCNASLMNQRAETLKLEACFVAVGKRLCALHAEDVYLLSVVSREVPHLPEHGESYGTNIWIHFLIRCINHVLFLQNAYTATAINSTNFCTSARDAFFILAENALRVAAINSVGDFVLFLGKVFIHRFTTSLYTAEKSVLL